MQLEIWTWIGIAVCLSQSALFSGLNIGLFSLSKLRLEAEASSGSRAARRVLRLRKNANRLLATILWGNVAANCLLTLLSDSVLLGLAAFIFSTFAITIAGEIIPQAYCSRHALSIGSFLAPVMRFYMFLLYPLAGPTSWVLDRLVGQESRVYFRESDLHFILHRHTEDEDTEIGEVEGKGAINFLHLDDIPVCREGEVIDPKSIVSLPTKNGVVVFPEMATEPEELVEDPFIRQVNSSEVPWIIITDEEMAPKFVLDADGLIRDLLSGIHRRPYYYCHRPILITDPATTLEDIIGKLHVDKTHAEDDVIDDDIVLYWSEDEKRIITGADILGRLLRGIVATRDAA